MAVYADLFFNNIDSLVVGELPGDPLAVRRRRLARTGARVLPRPSLPHAALHRYRARVHPLSRNARDATGDPPFLAELAHYEWIELALTLDESDIATIAHDPARRRRSTASRSSRRSRACSRIAFRCIASVRISGRGSAGAADADPARARSRRRAPLPRNRRADGAPVRAAAAEHRDRPAARASMRCSPSSDARRCRAARFGPGDPAAAARARRADRNAPELVPDRPRPQRRASALLHSTATFLPAYGRRTAVR